MKLNVRSESNLSHGLTPVVTTPVHASGASGRPAAHAHTQVLCAGTQTDPPRRRCGRAAGVLYLVGVLGMLCVPLGLPVAMTQAVRILAEPDATVRGSLQHAFRAVVHERADAAKGHDWSRWAVVRNGRLYVSETFENRLNQYSGLVYASVRQRFGTGCEGDAEVGFALNSGDGIGGWVEVTMRCGAGSCVRKAPVEDVRRLVVGVQEGGHYVSAGGRVWGPLRGALRVGLDGRGVLGLRRVCGGGVERVGVAVSDVRDIVGDAVDVFRLDVGDVKRVQKSKGRE